MYFHWPIVFSRGCPHPCEYCAVQTYYDRTFRTRPVEEVIADIETIRSLGGDRLLILDDNPVARPEAAKELFRAMIPYGMKWASQSTINIARDPELLDLAARSGCVSLSIGLESVNEESLAGVKKGFNLPKRYERDLRAIREKGIQVIALIMVGLDGDDLGTFGRTLQFLEDNKISFLKMFTPCPYPGTKYHADLEAAGRILTHDLRQYDYGSPLVQPLGMSADEMMDGFKDVYRAVLLAPLDRQAHAAAAEGRLARNRRLRLGELQGEPLPPPKPLGLGNDQLGSRVGFARPAEAATVPLVRSSHGRLPAALSSRKDPAFVRGNRRPIGVPAQRSVNARLPDSRP